MVLRDAVRGLLVSVPSSPLTQGYIRANYSKREKAEAGRSSVLYVY